MSFSQLYYHIIFRRKNSQRVICEEYEKELYKYIWMKCKDMNCQLIRINGMPDHIHLLVALPTTLSVADFVKTIKQTTNIFIRNNRQLFPAFESWGKSFCALTYGRSAVPTVKAYIMNQKQHHAKISYEDELRKIFQDNGIAYKEDFLLKD